MQVELKEYVVTLKDEALWGDEEDINAVQISSLRLSKDDEARIARQAKNGGGKIDINSMSFDGKLMLEAKYKAAEVLILEIKKGDAVVPFTREWLRSLPVSDGTKIEEAIAEIRSVGKK